MAFWKGMTIPKTIKENFKENEMIQLAEEGQQLWSGIAKVSKVEDGCYYWGPHDDYTTYTQTVNLELEGKNGLETYELHYENRHNPIDNKFTEGTNIAFIGSKEGDKLQLIMIGEPADLEEIQAKVKDATENGQTIIKMNKLKEQLQSAGTLLAKPIRAAFNELKESWEARKQAKEAREKAKIAEEKAKRDARNGRPTGIYSAPEEQSRNGNISK